MKLLLEFKDYNELNFVKDVVNDAFLSEIDESINPQIHKSVITISDCEINCHDLERSEWSSDLEFRSYLVAFNQRMNKETFDNISPRINSTLSQEFDENIKCVALQFFPINEFVICNIDEYSILESINEFEYSIEDEIYEIKDNEYTSVIDLTTDDFDNKKSLTIWLREYSSKFGINLKLNRDKIVSNNLNYKISTSFFFNSSRDLNGRWIQDLDLDKPEGKHKSDLNLKDWIKKNLHSTKWNIMSKLKEIEEKINSLHLTFDLNLDSDSNDEAKRFINMVREKVLPILSNEESNRLKELYEQFNKLKDYNIDAEWQNQGNYFYLFDINYREEHYIINIKYDIKKDLIKIHMLHPSDLSDEIKIEDFCDAIYLLLEEN
jgi:hypothetical protein